MSVQTKNHYGRKLILPAKFFKISPQYKNANTAMAVPFKIKKTYKVSNLEM